MPKLVVIIFTSILPLFFQNCGTGFGNPDAVGEMQVGFAPYDEKVKPNKKNQQTANATNFTSVENLHLCIKKFKFTHQVSEEGEKAEKFEVPFGDIEILPGGTPIGDIEVPQGLYQKLELELEGKACESGLAIQFNNKEGEFSYDKKIKLKYEGLIVVEDGTYSLNLATRELVKALDKIDEETEIKPTIEALNLFFSAEEVVEEDDDEEADCSAQKPKKKKKGKDKEDDDDCE